MSRIRYDNVLGLLGAPLTASGTTITFQSVPAFKTIVSPDYVPIILEGSQVNAPSSAYEVVYLTAYTQGAATGTIVRGQEGTTGVAHLAGVPWAVGATSQDFLTYSVAARAYRS